MNKLTQNLFQVIYPFYPLWAWLTVSYTNFPPDKFLIFLVLPILIYNLWNRKIKVPVYLIFFILFTLFHLYSVFANDTMPDNTTPILFFFSDPNVLACILMLVIESTNFDEKFIIRMNRHILWIVVLSLVVSVIQIKSPEFFYNVPTEAEDLIFLEESRNASIYSWLGQNAVGISFPILIAILLNYYDTKSRQFSIIIFCGIVVAFLTKARYVMISTILAFSQLLLVKTVSLKKKLLVLLFFVIGIFIITLVTELVGYDISKTINERILEKESDMGSAKARVLSYEVFMLKFPENPILGVGPKTRKDVLELLEGHAPVIHVGYLAYLYYYGIFGAMLLFLALFFLLRDGWIIGKRHEFWGSFYGLIGFAFANTTFISFYFNEMGIVLAVIYMRYYKGNAERLYV